MDFRGHGHRQAVSVRQMNLPMTDDEAINILAERGFEVIDVDLLATARSAIGSTYRRGARLREAPSVFDCSSLMKWLYRHRGIDLPRRAIQQFRFGQGIEPDQPPIMGDLLFTKGWINRYESDPNQGIGHVVFATGEGTVIHASNKTRGVVEDPVSEMLDRRELCGIRRLFTPDDRVLTLRCPPEREIESADDIRWIILSALG